MNKKMTPTTTIIMIDKLRKSPAQAYQNNMLIIAPGQPFEAIVEHLIDPWQSLLFQNLVPRTFAMCKYNSEIHSLKWYVGKSVIRLQVYEVIKLFSKASLVIKIE